MAGGVWFEESRRLWAVWFAWKGQKKVYRKSLTGDPFYAEKQATRFLERIRGDIDRLKDRFDPSVYGMDKRLLIENAWETYNEQSPCGPSRRRQRDEIFERHIKPYFKGRSIKDVHFLDLDEWKRTIEPKFKPSYVRNIVVTFKHFFRFWHNREMLDRMPGFPSVEVPHKEIKWLTEEQQAHVHEFIPTQHLPIFRFLRDYGRRPSEACQLKREDIDWQKKQIRINNTKTSMIDALPIGSDFETYLKRDNISLFYIFCTPNGKPYSRQILYAIWERASQKAHTKYGTPVVTNYEGNRKSFATQRAGKYDMALISAVMGHADMRTTQRYYGRAMTEKMEQIIELPNPKNNPNKG